MNKGIKRNLKRNKDLLLSSDKSLGALFEIMFVHNSGVLCEGNDGYRTYRYTVSEMHNRIVNAAANLYDRIGATHSYVALEMDNSPEWIVGFWAILASGNKPYLVNLRYPSSLTEGIYTTLGIRYTICSGDTAVCGEAIDIFTLNSEHEPLDRALFENEIAFSSSATSMNEVVCFYSGAEISEQILNFKSIVKLNPRIAKGYKGSVKQLAFLPFYHIFGLFAVYFWFTFFGSVLVFLRDYSADTILATVRRHEVTHIFAVPMLWHTVEKQIISSARESGEEAKLRKGIKFMTDVQNVFPSLGAEFAKRTMNQVTDNLFGRSVMFTISGGSYIRDSALELINGIGYSLHNGFGMSEVAITSVELRRKPKYLNENSIGRPFDSVEYRLDDDSTLLIKGNSLCKHKLVNGEEVVIDDWFNTGDIAEERGGNYFILGRKGDIVIGESGENINPDTVEKVFLSCSAKSMSVLGIKDEDGEILSAIVQISPYASGESISRLRDEIYAINDTLPTTSRVSAFYFTHDELAPPTAVKVSRTQLMRKVDSGEISLIPFNEIDSTLAVDIEESPLANEVREIIAHVLGISEDGIVASTHVFYDLGATSIQYFSILSELSEHFEITNYNRSDKYCYTIKEMCEYIERHL